MERKLLFEKKEKGEKERASSKKNRGLDGNPG